jgi:hypothetical protein
MMRDLRAVSRLVCLLALASGCGDDDDDMVGPDAATDAAPVIDGAAVDAAASPLSVTVDGSPVTSLLFDYTGIGHSMAVDFTVTNGSAEPTGPLAIELSGDPDFTIDGDASDCPGQSLGVGASCHLVVLFQPTVDGVRTASLTISADPGGSAVVSLSGLGITDPLAIDLAGDAGGEVQVIGETVSEVCIHDCTLSVPTGETVTLVAITPSTFGGWGGLCSDAYPVCTFTMPASGSVTATFVKDAAEQWTVLLPADSALSVDYDAGGDLVVGTTDGLFKLSAAGDPIWSAASLPGVARFGADGDIYVRTGHDLVKVSTDGDVIWSRDIGTGTDYCDDDRFRPHSWAASPNGDIALQIGQTLRVFTSDGDVHFAVADISSHCAVAIAADGTIYTAIENASADQTALLPFTATGTPLGETEIVGTQRGAGLAIDGLGHIAISVAGFSQVAVNRRLLGSAVDFTFSQVLPQAVFSINGVAADPTGQITWIHTNSTKSVIYGGFEARRFGPTGTLLWSLIRPAYPHEFYYSVFGVEAHDVADDGNGNVAIVGVYAGPAAGPVAMIQTYHF